ncbi:hypothetical protein ACFL34_00065 [Candidatus Sumerlaeota bacterium]
MKPQVVENSGCCSAPDLIFFTITRENLCAGRPTFHIVHEQAQTAASEVMRGKKLRTDEAAQTITRVNPYPRKGKLNYD